jgi:ATP-dependent Clp protease ATP-binding subunit ClpC
MMRFDRFTERAQDAAARAYEVLTRYGHSQIDTEHLLMALLEQPEGVASQILVQLGVDPDVVIAKLDEELRKSPRATIYGGSTAQVFITPRVKRILDVANEEANRFRDEYISTEHLFLAICSERNTPAERILERRDQGPAPRPARRGPQGREQVSHPGEVLARPDPDGQRGQA